MLATSHSVVVLHLQVILHLQVYKNIPMWKSVSSASEGGSSADNRMEKLEKYVTEHKIKHVYAKFYNIII